MQAAMADVPWSLWGSELSPFSLKARALLDWSEIPYVWLPNDGARFQNLRAAWRIERAKRTRTAVRYPATSDLDEYPLVPFLLCGDAVHYDSTAIARLVDDRRPPPGGPTVPAEPAAAFVASLIDEAFDEIGLYVVHHFRWVVSASTNDAGQRLARELRRHAPPGTGPLIAWWFPRRQVRRLPYLFSIAAPDAAWPGLPTPLTPPARAGFPPTHALLERTWGLLIDAVEHALGRSPFLLGDRFTIADAGVYGALGMNLADPTAYERMRERAPTTVRWLEGIRDRRHVGTRGDVRMTDAITPLLEAIRDTFVPLMTQNERAWRTARERGARRFNEAAFDAGESLYDGTLLGHPFRSVVKTFQVRVWQELTERWTALVPPDRERVVALAGGQPLSERGAAPGGIE